MCTQNHERRKRKTTQNHSIIYYHLTLSSHHLTLTYHNPSLGLATKARVCKSASQNWARESHFILSGVQKSVREWTFTLPSELPFWELESQWTPESSKGDCKGQNSFDWKFPYIIGKFLECRCPKWAHMTHLETWNTSWGFYWDSKCSILKL
jgi:hypothetical protein